MTDCTGGMQFCNFEPRYDESLTAVPRNLSFAENMEVETIEALADLLYHMRSKFYVCDVCTKCGKIGQRPRELNGRTATTT